MNSGALLPCYLVGALKAQLEPLVSDHVIAINESQLRRVIRSYVAYYHEDRTHLGLGKDVPEERPIEPETMGKVVAIPRVGGLHHRYARGARFAA